MGSELEAPYSKLEVNSNDVQSPSLCTSQEHNRRVIQANEVTVIPEAIVGDQGRTFNSMVV